MKRSNNALFLLASLALASAAHAQTYSRTETIEYHDNTALWVLGQVKKVTCVTASSTENTNSCDNDVSAVISQTDYDANALRWKTYAFGKLNQTITYDTTSAVGTGQRGTMRTVADGRGNVTTATNWKRGTPQHIRHPVTPESPAGAVQTAVVNDSGWITSVTDETASKTCYEYDAMGRIKKITYPSETANVCDTSKWNATTIDFSAGHDEAYGVPEGHWRQTTLTGHGRRILVLDALWRPVVEQTLDLGNVADTHSEVITRYDTSGRVAFKSYPMRTNGAAVFTDPTLKGTHTTYDALDRVTQVKQDWEGSGQLTTTTEYLAGFKTRVTPPKGTAHQTTTEYMAYDQPTTDWPVKITHPIPVFTHISRDAHGKPTRIRRSNSSSPTGGTVSLDRVYTYGGQQMLCEVREPETGSTVHWFDAANNLSRTVGGLTIAPGTSCADAKTYADTQNRHADRTYDARNRLTALTFADGKGDQAWTYTPDGLPAKIVTSQPSVVPVENTYTYNRRRLLASETTKIAGALPLHQYTYNANGHLSGVVYGSGLSVDYAPNALGLPTQAGTFASAVKYHPNGAIKSFTYGNGIQHTLTQNIRGLPDTSCDFYGTCTATSFLNDGYDYDQNGNVTSISDGRTGARGHRTMTYDVMDRLTGVTTPNPATSFFGNATYTYDLFDNLMRTYVTHGNNARNHYYCYDAQWRLDFVRSGPNCTGTASPAVITLDFDEQGNLEEKNNRTYEFDFGNRLRRVREAGTSLEWYAYDGHGRRVLSCTPTACDYQQYGFDGKRYWNRDNRAGKLYDHVYLGSSLVAIRDQPTAGGAVSVRYQHTDALGTPIAITNEARGSVERTENEPYGWPANRAWRDGPGYTGHHEDAATKLNYMQQRYYDPMIGRFLSVDPVTAYGTGDMRLFNRYAYTANNPYTFKDPDGRVFDTIADVGFIAYSAYKLATEPSWTNAAALGADIVGAAVPLATGLGAGVRAAAHGADAARGADAAGSALKQGDLHAPGDAPDATVIVRGGQADMPATGTTFSGSQGRTVEEAGSGVPHGTIRTSTAGEIRANGGQVQVAPEPTRSGQINGQHVNVTEGGRSTTFSQPQPNPVPKDERIK